jgi:hypothetical protein
MPKMKKQNEEMPSSVRCLVYDTGLGVEHALRLQNDGWDVTYFTEWAHKGFPVFEDYAPALGMVKKTKYFFEELPDCDIVFFPDCGKGDLVAEIKRKYGKPVWGGGPAEILELDRIKALEIMDQYGIAYPETQVVRGVSKLREILQRTNEKVFVKFNIWRGKQETFSVEKYSKAVELKLARLELAFGPFADDIDFLVQKEAKGVEPGFDLIFNGNEFLEPCQYGYEVKGTGVYLGRLVPTINSLPAPIREVAERIKPFLQENDYRGAISTEGIVGKDREMKLIDWTCRMPYPLSAIYTVNFRNYSEIVWKVANKQPVDLDIRAPYVGIVTFESEFALNDWLDIYFDSKYRDRIRLRIGCKKEDIYYAVPGFVSVVSIIGLGGSVDEVCQDIERIFDESGLDAFQITKESLGGLDFAKKVIEEGKKYGIDF